ncbi:PH domain-containing protein [Psychroserpens damuponensis]|nr:PH domain-containing protein [Psychroserpens damuponensis]
MFMFTSKRLILIDVHGVTGSKVKYSKKELTFDKAIALGYTACSICEHTR